MSRHAHLDSSVAVYVGIGGCARIHVTQARRTRMHARVCTRTNWHACTNTCARKHTHTHLHARTHREKERERVVYQDNGTKEKVFENSIYIYLYVTLTERLTKKKPPNTLENQNKRRGGRQSATHRSCTSWRQQGSSGQWSHRGTRRGRWGTSGCWRFSQSSRAHQPLSREQIKTECVVSSPSYVSFDSKQQ